MKFYNDVNGLKVDYSPLSYKLDVVSDNSSKFSANLSTGLTSTVANVLLAMGVDEVTVNCISAISGVLTDKVKLTVNEAVTDSVSVSSTML